MGASFVVAGNPGDEEARTLVWNPDREQFMTLFEGITNPTAFKTAIFGRRLAG